MCVNILKTLLYAAGICLLGGLGRTTCSFIEESQDSIVAESFRMGNVFFGVPVPRAPEPRQLDYRKDVSPAILDFDWTGAPRKDLNGWEFGGCGGPPEEIKTPVGDLLDVVAIICVNDNPAESAALIRLVDQDGSKVGDDVWMSTGDALPPPNDDVSVLDITSDHVEFSFADEERDRERVAPQARDR